MSNTKRYIFTIAIIGLGISASAQKKDENIGTEVVNVVKPYTPTISDAYKVKETPVLDDEETAKKKNIQYNIFSFPVASTFAPSKGHAAGVDKEAQEKIYSNYASLAVGNYSTINGELFLTQNVGDNGYVGAMVRHLSSGGGIKSAELDDSFHNSSIDLTYGTRTQALAWNLDAGYQDQGYNWYGLPADFGSALTPEDRQAVIDSINPKHTYHDAYLGTRLHFNDGIFSGVDAKFNRFWDSYNAAENRFTAKPSLDVAFNDTKIRLDLIVDYLGGQFDANLNDLANKYSYTNIGAHPSFRINKDDWTIDLGATAFYSMGKLGDDTQNKFFIYPAVNASYKLVGDLMVFYAGAEGTLQQNSYRDLANENPFMAPILAIAPTDKQYDIFAGLKGKLASGVSYNVRGSYVNERGKALLKANDYDAPVIADFDYGNSFQVVYDDVKTVSVFGEIKADFSKHVTFGVNATVNSYGTDLEDEAWNLPALKIGSTLDVDITPKWYAGAQVFFIGERKDAQSDLDSPSGGGTVTLKSYFDGNLHVGYKHNDRLTGFLKVNNIANQQYQKWLNYPVQGIQVMLGASYKFDF
jgi:outer membrane receptor protein involved in Fe transport